jgi:type I restriction enzyme M protein
LDWVLEHTQAQVMEEKAKLEEKGLKDAALDKALSRVAVGKERSQPLYNRHSAPPFATIAHFRPN